MRYVRSFATYFVIGVLLLPLVGAFNVEAEQLNSRSVRVITSRPSATTQHRFTFDIPTVSSVGSIDFQYCSNSPLEGQPCTAPTGFSALAATIASQTGETGFTIDPASTVNRIILTRAASLTSIGTATYNFNNITNQSTANSVAYVRIATYASIDATGASTDSGAVAYSTTNPLSVTAFVPPYLTFCTGVTVVLNCSSSSGVYLNFGELSRQQPNTSTSQFSVATNDPAGYTTSVFGTTMTSGTNVIPALSAPTNSRPGVSQFGMNLRANSVPSVGSNPAGVGSGTINSDYNQPNRFAFDEGILASSPIPSNFKMYTASYLINVGQSQKPGVYTTTLTYVATAAF